MKVIRVLDTMGAIALADLPPSAGLPMYVKSYDPDAHAGRGAATWTGDVREALTFKDGAAAWDFWRQQSTVLPLRPDGKPNRPLTAFTVSIEDAPA